jgi:hypothetical protein
MVAAVVLSVALGMTAPAAAEEENRFAKDFGYGVGAFFTNLIYMPAKFVYATLGGVTGGFAYVLTGLNFDVAKRIWVPSTAATTWSPRRCCAATSRSTSAVRRRRSMRRVHAPRKTSVPSGSATRTARRTESGRPVTLVSTGPFCQ